MRLKKKSYETQGRMKNIKTLQLHCQANEKKSIKTLSYKQSEKRTLDLNRIITFHYLEKNTRCSKEYFQKSASKYATSKKHYDLISNYQL